MILKTKAHLKGGFSLLEMTVVLIIMTVLASAVIPQLTKQYTVNAANKTALDISAIEEASRAYYVQNNSWPASIAVLQAGNFLPASWNGINPFGYSSPNPTTYSYNISSGNSVLTVSTIVPIASQPMIQNLLPVTFVSGNTIDSSVAVPGSLSVVPSGTVLAWPGTIAPSGFLLCDGSVYSTSSYPNLAPVLSSTFGGNGITSFAVPDLRGRIIAGLNTMAINDGTDRIWSTDNYSNNLGQAASYSVNLIGSVFGEEKHRQTVVEMAPHTHPFTSWDYVKGFSGNSTSSPRDPQGGNTGSAGGNGDGTGLGAAANVVPPSMAMNYIIKY